VYAGQEVDPSIRHSEPITQQSEPSSWPQQQVASDSSPRYGQEPFQGTGNSFDHSQVYGGTSQTPYYQSNYAQSSSSSPPATSHPLPRHSYTRTLEARDFFPLPRSVCSDGGDLPAAFTSNERRGTSCTRSGINESPYKCFSRPCANIHRTLRRFLSQALPRSARYDGAVNRFWQSRSEATAAKSPRY